MSVSPIQDIIADIRAGKMVILVDEEDRENEGDLVIAAEHVTPEIINFMARHGRGLVCLTLTEERCRQLGLPQMARDNRSQFSTAFTVSIEAAEGVTTGISAHDRARTVQAAVAKNAKATDIVQPGHIFPIMAKPGGVLVRAGHTEAGCDLSAIAGCEPSAVICEILKEDGSMARLPDLIEYAKEHGLKIGTIADLIHYRSETETLIECVAEKEILSHHGVFRLTAFEDKTSGEVHLALTRGDIQRDQETLVRVQESASLLDFLDCKRTRSSFNVDQAMQTIATADSGVIILLQRQNPESGQSLLAALHADATDTPSRPAVKWDPRTYGIGAQILRSLGVGKMRLMSSPRKMPSMTGFGLEVCGYLAPDGSKT
ncbi:MAG: 3,4-dihydroxy-2-butanone-4-phosphate synthase [Sterolibacterium sp.]|nr:3,4-dihydroxy-2-butanone-4-phosphate synthase [Sterolibacterium sp.]